MKRLAMVCLLAGICTTPAVAEIQGSSTASNCGEGGNWIDLAFTTDEGVTLVDAWWDWNGTSVWLDGDGSSQCDMQNQGVTSFSFYFDVPAGTDTQDFGCTFTGFDGGDYFRFVMDLDLGTGGSGMPYGTDLMGGTVTVEFSDATVLTATFDTPYDGSNGATASFSNLPNLEFETQPGWASSLVPRPANDATWGSVPAPAFLIGEADSTWLNGCYRNTGQTMAGTSRMEFHLDGAYIGHRNLFTIAPGAWNGSVNVGTFDMPGGRHMLRVTADAWNQVAESDETDNVFTVQHCWQPDYLPPLTTWTRASPPLYNQDFEHGAGTWWNCDGVRIQPSASEDWAAVWGEREADDGLGNYMLRLHPASDHPDTAFGWNLATTSADANLHAVIVNTHTAGHAPLDVGVLSYSGHTEDYRISHLHESPYPFDFGIEPETPYFAARLLMFQFHVDPADLGPATLTLYSDPADGPVHMGWLAPDFTYGTLADLNVPVVTDAEGYAKIDLDLTVTGAYCCVVYGNRPEHPAGLAVNVGLYGPLPDLVPVAMANWYAPIVPRPAADAALLYCPLPDTLHGGVAQTWMNFAGYNDGTADAYDRSFAIDIDGGYKLGMWNPETWAAGAYRTYYNYEYGQEPWTVAGGRHTVASRVEYREMVTESVERNNDSGRQYCWSPLVLPTNASLTRDGNPLPDREGGWENCDGGQPLYWNCDGLRMPYVPPIGGNWHWAGTAVMPYDLGTDIDVQLHAPLAGTQDGFGPEVLAESASGDGQIDFVLVNDRYAENRSHDVGVLDDVDQPVPRYYVQEARSTWGGIPGPGETGPYAMGPGRMLNLHEYLLDPGYWLITLTDNGSGVDWGMSLYMDGTYHGKDDALAGAMAWQEGDGVTERMHVNVPTGSTACLAVWKANYGELNKDGSYSLWFGQGVSAVGEETPAPAATRLVGAAPNPFNPSTTISFDLAQDGPCLLELYDLQGRRVRTLLAEDRRAGPHAVPWDGLDDRGTRAASGMYLARLRAAGTTDLLKLTLVK